MLDAEQELSLGAAGRAAGLSGMHHRPAGFFVLRTPLLPVAAVRALGGGAREALSVGVESSEFPAALERDLADRRATLESALADPAIRDAIEAASPSMTDAIARWRRLPDDPRSAKVERALIRYVTRAGGRPTPFGLFAGASLGELGERTNLELPSRRRYVRRSRISLGWATELAEALARRPDVRAELTYRANPSLYRLPGRWRYVSRRRGDDYLVHTLREVRDSPALRGALEQAREGARLDQLAQALLAEGERSAEQVSAFLDRLIEGQLLVADLAPPVIGGEPAEELIARLEDAPAAAATLANLRAAHTAVGKINAAGVGAAPERQREAVRSLEREGVAATAPVLTAELYKPATDLSLGPTAVSELERGVELLRRWNAGYVVAPLEEFVKEFWRRYGDREVPLAEALDEDAGVGLDALDKGQDEPQLAGERDHLAIGKLEQALREGAREIEIAEDDLDDSAVPLPSSFVVGARIEAASAAAVDAGEFTVFLKDVYGPAATGMLLPRFGVSNEAFRARLAAHAAAEEQLDPDALHAEIVGLPQLEFGPIMHGPRLRSFEIDYLGLSGAPPERRIALDDLLISVVLWRVMLRSRRTGQWVEPVLTCPLNLALKRPPLPPTFRFLALVARQWGVDLRWNWGALSGAPFLPRVRAGRVVLALARWNLGRRELEPLGRGSREERLGELLALRERLDVPRIAGLVEGDNVLPLDLDSSAGVDMLLTLLQGRKEAILQEVYPDPDALCVEGPEGRFTHELLVPYLARTPVRRPPLPAGPVSAPSPELRPSFPPGSRWLDVRFYAGTGLGDALVRDRIAPLCSHLVEEGIAERWFFLRYADPDPHLRVRIEGDPELLRRRALPLFNELAEGLMERRMSWRMALDTYEPEVARYGGPSAIGLAESWFCADSEAAAEALASQHRRRADAGERWRLALVAADAAFRQLTPDDEGRLAAARAARATLALSRGPRPQRDRQAAVLRRPLRGPLPGRAAGARGGAHGGARRRPRRAGGLRGVRRAGVALRAARRRAPRAGRARSARRRPPAHRLEPDPHAAKPAAAVAEGGHQPRARAAPLRRARAPLCVRAGAAGQPRSEGWMSDTGPTTVAHHPRIECDGDAVPAGLELYPGFVSEHERRSIKDPDPIQRHLARIGRCPGDAPGDVRGILRSSTCLGAGAGTAPGRRVRLPRSARRHAPHKVRARNGHHASYRSPQVWGPDCRSDVGLQWLLELGEDARWSEPCCSRGSLCAIGEHAVAVDSCGALHRRRRVQRPTV